MPSIKVPLLKVHAFADGRIVPLSRHRESPILPSDENWWESVMGDAQRQRDLTQEVRFDTASPYSFHRLDRQKGSVWFNCPCGNHGCFAQEKLISIFGKEANVLYVARKMLDCARRGEIANACRAYPMR